MGIQKILHQAGLNTIPEAHVAVFVGTEFDSTTGRGGNDGTPKRRTPWGEIAYQLGGEASLRFLADHEAEFIEPKGDVIRAFLPKDKPCLILMDEIINYVSTYRGIVKSFVSRVKFREGNDPQIRWQSDSRHPSNCG
jgi:hypothetical protein